MKLDAPYNEVVGFHGHSCPGLAIGYRVVQAAIDALDLSRSKDEELVAVVENDACGVDAIQYLLGCTFGKGNLIHRDYGKHAFTIFRRDTGKGVRILADFPRSDIEDQAQLTEILTRIKKGEATDEEMDRWNRYKADKTQAVLDAPAAEFITVKPVQTQLPQKAKVVDSVHCDRCNEKVMMTKTRENHGQTLCIPCAKEA